MNFCWNIGVVNIPVMEGGGARLWPPILIHLYPRVGLLYPVSCILHNAVR